jgi:regulator of protease activity HflC (stomatin/prohibitin superfamily)
MKSVLWNERGEVGFGMLIGVVAIALFIGLLFATGWGWAHFRLWKAEYSGKALEIEKTYKGKAVLAEAENARMARVEAARAEKEAAQLTADAIAIVGEAAQKYPEYRQQEFYLALGEALQEGQIDQIIYLPTEAGMPITEARNRQKAE